MTKQLKNNEVTSKQAALMLGVKPPYLYNQRYLYGKHGFSTLYLAPKYKQGCTYYYSIDDINIVKKQMKKTFHCKDKTVSIKLNGNDIYDHGGSFIELCQNDRQPEKLSKLVYKMPLNNTLPCTSKIIDIIVKYYGMTYQCKMRVHKIHIEKTMSVITLIPPVSI